MGFADFFKDSQVGIATRLFISRFTKIKGRGLGNNLVRQSLWRKSWLLVDVGVVGESQNRGLTP